MTAKHALKCFSGSCELDKIRLKKHRTKKADLVTNTHHYQELFNFLFYVTVNTPIDVGHL